MGFVLRLCLLLLITEICVLANPVIPQSGPAHESSVPKSTIRKLSMVGDDDPTEGPSPGATTAGPATTTEAPTTNKPGNRSSLTAPSIILSVSALIPIFLVNKL